MNPYADRWPAGQQTLSFTTEMASRRFHSGLLVWALVMLVWTHSGHSGLGFVNDDVFYLLRESVLFIDTRFNNLYTAVDAPSEVA
jgi:hypothetical protein